MRFVQSRQAPRFAGVIAIICAISPIPARSDVLNDWTDVALASAAAARQSPFVQTRTMAMVHLALFEAINGADGPYTSYLTRRRDPGHRAVRILRTIIM